MGSCRNQQRPASSPGGGSLFEVLPQRSALFWTLWGLHERRSQFFVISVNLSRLDLGTFQWKAASKSEYPLAQAGLQYQDSTLYVFGGLLNTADGLSDMTDVLSYDLTQGTWKTIKTPGFVPRVQFSSCGYQGTFFVFPGWSQSAALMVDQVQTWKVGETVWKNSTLPTFELAEYGFFALASTVYVFAGRSSLELSNGLTLINLSQSTSQVLTASSNNPGPLSYPSMTSISQFVVLFGGVKQDSLSNDLWTFDIFSIEWNKVLTSGDLPSPRSHCGIAGQGDSLIVWGGKTMEGSVNDMFLLNFKTKYWMKVPVYSELQPSARFGPCIVLDLPSLYLFGGKASDGISSTLWKFDFENFQYSIVKINSKFEAGFSQYCEFIKDDKDSSLFLGFGTGSLDKPLGYINSFNFSSNKWSTLYEASEKMSRSDSLIHRSNNELFIIGGQTWSTFLYKTIQKINFSLKKAETLQKDLGQYLYAGGSKFLKDSLYIYGGAGSFSSVPQPFETLSQFYQLKISDICPGCTQYCSPGSYLSGSKCVLCPAGTYTTTFNSTTCQDCPLGTENKVKGASSERQCYPCPEGFYADSPGTSNCLKCAEGFNCPIGSSMSSSTNLTDFVKSEQPKILARKTKEAARIGGAIQIAVFVVGFLILFVLLFTEKTRKIIKTIDMYTSSHNYQLDVPMIMTKTFFGSFFSMVFFIVALILVIQTIILYQLDNVSENKRLIPVVILQDTLDEEFLADFSVKLSLHNYGGKCTSSKNTCVPELSVSLNSIKRESYSTSCEKTSENTCIFELSCNTCQVSVESTMLFSMKEPFSYSTAVGVNFSSDSSIPDKPSKIATLKTADKGRVFRGPEPTVFYFSLIPSLFENDGKQKTGYHVTSESGALEGTLVSPDQFGFTSYQYVLVKVSSDNNSLFTERKTIYTLFLLIMALIGSVVGMMNIIGGAMSFVEGNYLTRKAAYDKNKKNQKLKDNRKLALKNLTTEDDYTRGDI